MGLGRPVSIWHLFPLLFLSFQLNAHELYVRAQLLPLGNFEIFTQKLYGDVIYSKKKDFYFSKSMSVRINKLDTGITLRNQHLYKYLNAKKFKRIEMSQVKVKGKSGKGLIKINGVRKVVKFKVVEDTEKGKLSTKFLIKLADFRLRPPTYLGITVMDEIQVQVVIDKKDVIEK